ncbi:Glyceraldehyde-3-phosphate dehydrogenase [Phytophthora nicotianae]|uniref:catechol O-methyltransferase n=1 Tax=Phytophthora nicotianae TaxID=4792 RepID=A0A0W8DT36_PHYNI|nr:Glyceraldehyde-3-phosphate dehydrogenase [Phytophthora nicotianae]
MPPRVATTKPGPQPTTSSGEKCLSFVHENAKQGDAKSVVAAIDTFGYEHHWMMNVGDVKGDLLDAELEKVKPKVGLLITVEYRIEVNSGLWIQILVELGGHLGYSAIRFASKMRELSGPSAHVYSFEISPDFAAIATKMIEYAGLSDMVTIIVGTYGDNYEKLKEQHVDHVDVFFIDHDKKKYKSDLEIIEQCGLLRSGSVVIADNVLFAGVSDYLEYIRGSPYFKSVLFESYHEYSDLKDAIEISTYKA